MNGDEPHGHSSHAAGGRIDSLDLDQNGHSVVA